MGSTKRSLTPPPTSRASRVPPSLAPKAIEDEVVAVAGVRADFDAFAAAARAVDPSRVQTFRGDASLAYHNALAGLEAVRAERAAVEASGLRVDWAALDQIPRIALGLVYASEQVDGRPGADEDLQTKLARARVLYDIGVSSADALAKSGDLPAAEVRKLRAPGSPLNLAHALVRLADFFTRHGDRVKGLTPFRAPLVREAAKLGGELLTRVLPAGARRPKKAALAEAQRDRDAFAALLVERYEALERVAGARWGRALGEQVPALQSRVQKARKRKAPASPAPVPA